jgi:hypothetical protein
MVRQEATLSESKWAEKNSRPARLEFTRDPAAIQKFMNLRRALYEADPRFVGFREFHRETLDSYILPHHYTLLMWDGDRCIGGGRLTLVKKGEKLPLLPLEQDFMEDMNAAPPFRICDMAKSLHLQKYSYVEASRMLIHPDYRHQPQHIVDLFSLLLRRAQDLGAYYFFAMTDNLRLRLYKKIASVHLGLVGQKLDVALPDKPVFEGIRMSILMWDIHTDPSSK